MKFKFVKIGGGYHPLIDIKLNGKKCKALIDTGANCTILTTENGQAELEINGTFYLIPTKYKKEYPIKNVLIILGNDILIREGAVIDYPKKEIIFTK